METNKKKWEAPEISDLGVDATLSNPTPNVRETAEFKS